MTNVVEESIAVISSEEAFTIPDRMSRKKWNGPWWHIATLCEMGEADRIPKETAQRALELLKHGAWPKFVITKEDAPSINSDRAKMDCCHCELGVFYATLSRCGCVIVKEIPWIREWFLKHQLPDGGLNCTPSAYRNSLKSSIVSTLPPLEAILFFTERKFTNKEEKLLDEGASYLVDHRLVCRKSDGSVINQEWLKPLFPRFFEYDILRGMHYLVEWSKRRKKTLPRKVILEGIGRMRNYIDGSNVTIGRHVNDKNGDWHGRTFPLLKSVSRVGDVSPYLTKQLKIIVEAVGKS